MLESLYVVAWIEYVKIFNNFDTVAEWLTRRPAKPFSSWGAGSNPAGVDGYGSLKTNKKWRKTNKKIN